MAQKKESISVCMAVYNGERFIEEQLQSILCQTRQPDEVILCDDGSTDDTVRILESFLEKNNLRTNWKLYQNQKNLGYPANFYHAMDLCTKDIVFLADQDDIWHIDKISKMAAVFEADMDLKAVSCKFALIDENGGDLHTVMSPSRSKETDSKKYICVRNIFYKYEWPGMVMAYRRNWYDRWKRGGYTAPHDILLAVRAAEEKGFVQIDECLAFQRRHGNNTGGEEHRISKLLNRDRKLWEIQKYLDILKDFEEKDVFETEEGKEELRKKNEAMSGRYAALKSQKTGEVIKNAWKNRKETRFATAVCDVAITLGKR